MDRRSFVFAAGSACMLPPLNLFGAGSAEAHGEVSSRARLRSFDYQGVRLLDGRFQQQVIATRALYFGMSDDDMLKGFRRAAGLPAPGNDMRGWCRDNCGATFGQWISGMARLSRATGDTELREKAIRLTTEWEKTLGPNGNARMNTYAWEKMSCGLVDLAMYADYPHALEILERITVWAAAHFDRSRSPATEADRDGRRPHGTLEWYTLPENSLRAYAITGNKVFLDFADLWLYPTYWNKFADTDRPQGVAYLHSYSHVNTFCGAAMMYSVTGDPRYLQIVRNAYAWVRGTQAYASGGYGPGEWSVPADGSLGQALDVRLDTAEIPCGSWAGFKLSRYLMGFTGDARYGDWIETLLYNGIGASLPVQPDGRSFYYADYRVGTGAKTFFWDEWPCCSGTYIQTVADFHNVIYFHDDDGLSVNLAVPSEVEWKHGGQMVRVRQETSFPETEETTLHVAVERPAEFAVRVRVPSWCGDGSVTVNGAPIVVKMEPNTWATVRRTWQTGDMVTVKFPLRARAVPVDAQHPNRVAMMYGPLLMAQDARFSFPLHGDPRAVAARLTRAPGKMQLQLGPEAPAELNEGGQKVVPASIDEGGQQVGNLHPFYMFKEREPYRTYFDMDKPRFL